MNRVAGAWLTFSILGGLIGITTFSMLFFGFSAQNWIAISACWGIGLSAGAALAPFRWARTFTAMLLYELFLIPWLN